MSKLNKKTLELKDEETSNFKKGKKNGFSKKGKFGKKIWKGKDKNDPSWYAKSPQMVKDVASIPFNHMAGFPIDLSSRGSVGAPAAQLCYLRTFIIDWFAGVSNDFRSILNNASTNLWSFIRGRNSGATNYQASDVFINTVLASIDIFANLVSIERLFKFYDHYSAHNRLIPKMIFTASGIDFEDFIANVAAYRYYYNQLIAKASSLVIPDEFPIIKQVMSQFADIYKDRDSDTGKEQLYMKIKLVHHIYDPTYNPQGGGVRLMDLRDIGNPAGASDPEKCILLTGTYSNYNGVITDRLTKLSWLITIVEKQINAMITDEDVNIMFGDFIKAFGDSGNFFKLSELKEDVKGEFIYSEEILEQIHNSSALPNVFHKYALHDVNTQISDVFGNTIQGNMLLYIATSSSSSVARYKNNIFQDAQGYILTDLSYFCDNVITGAVYDRWQSKVLVDTNDLNPSPEKVMNMTRLLNRYSNTSYTGTYARTEFRPSACSSLILFDGMVFAGNVANNSIFTYDVDTNLIVSNTSQGSNLPIGTAAFLASNSQFDWAPIVYVAVQDTNTGTTTMIPMSDLNNVTSIDPVDLDRIHEVGFLSLYDVPKTR